VKIHVISTGHNQPLHQINRLIDSVYSDPQPCEVRLHIYNETDDDRRGAAFRRYDIIRNNPAPIIADDDVIMLVGLDDHLLPNAIRTIYEAHQSGAWVTYGNWQNQHGRVNSLQVEWRGQPLRTAPFFLTAPNTFRAGLYRRIPIKRLQVDGTWQHVCTEVDVMYSCAEMAGQDRTMLITEPIYHYNERLPTGTLSQFGKARKGEVLRIIQGRTPFDILELL